MAVTETDRSIRVQMMLNNGTTQTGQIKTVAVSLGKISLTRYNATKAITIADAVSEMLAKDMAELRKTTISMLLYE